MAASQPPHVEQRHQADPKADGVDQAERGELAPGGLALGGLLERLLDRLGGVGEDLNQQEQQDPGRGGVEERLGPQARHPDPAQRQAEVNGEPGDRAQQDRLRCGQPNGLLGNVTASSV